MLYFFNKIFLSLFFILNTCAQHKEPINTFFSLNCQKKIVYAINDARASLDIAVYSINNPDIVQALIAAKARGVEIRILTDRLQAFGHSSKVEFLHDRDFNIKVHSKERIMHHKFAIIDGEQVVFGSFNWTYSAARRNAEDCSFVSDENSLTVFQDRFNELWAANKLETSECYFDNMKLDKEHRASCKTDRGRYR